ncbi:hypothetical protein Tco_1286803 [Tanacetum coccineum]
MIQHEFITLTLAQLGQILKIPYNGQAVFTNEWDLESLEYSQETKGPYCTDLPTLDDIRQLIELERIVNSFERDRLLACFAHMLYYVVAEEQYNPAYFFVKRIECAKATPAANLPYGMFLTRDDDEDDGASRASTPSPTTYLNSLHSLNYQNHHMPSFSEQTDETPFAQQTTLLNPMHEEMHGGFKSFVKALKRVFSKKKK